MSMQSQTKKRRRSRYNTATPLSAFDDRGTNRTTNQIKNAPMDCIYIWCNQHLAYPRALAVQLGRADIQVVSPSVLMRGGERLRGLDRYIITDHALDHIDAYHEGRKFIGIENAKYESIHGTVENENRKSQEHTSEV